MRHEKKKKLLRIKNLNNYSRQEVVPWNNLTLSRIF